MGKCRLLCLFSLSLLGLCIALNAQASVHALGSSQWVNADGDPLVLHGDNLTDAEFDDLLNSKFSILGSLECEQEQLPAGPPESGQAIDECWYDTNIGKFSYYSVKPAGAEYAGWREEWESELFPTMNPDVFAEVVTDIDSNLSLRFRTTEDAQFEVASGENEYPVRYTWASPATFTLQNETACPPPHTLNTLPS